MTRRIGRLIGIGAFATIGLGGVSFAQSDTGINPTPQQEQPSTLDKGPSSDDVNKLGGSDTDQGNLFEKDKGKSQEAQPAEPGSEMEKKSGSDTGGEINPPGSNPTQNELNNPSQPQQNPEANPPPAPPPTTPPEK